MNAFFIIPAALNQGPEIRQFLYYIGNYKPKGKGDTYPDHRINKRGMRRILQQYPIKDWTGDIARSKSITPKERLPSVVRILRVLSETVWWVNQ